MTTCPRCGGELSEGVNTCRHCLHVLDPEYRRRHDAGRLGADGRGGGTELRDPPIGPLPVTGAHVAGGAFGAVSGALRLVAAGLHLMPRKRRRPGQ